MNIKDLRGLKYPDDYLIRFFFKEGLHQKSGRVLELGCGNGNNLALFYQYGWDVAGIDFNSQSIADANHNFALLEGAGSRSEFFLHDLNLGLPDGLRGPFDCLSLANVIYYLERDSYYRLLKQLRPLLASKAHVFLRARTPRDYRYARGRQVAPDSFVLGCAETGEEGCAMTFYREHELFDQMTNGLGVAGEDLRVFQTEFQNIQNDHLVSNADVVMWGRRHG